MANYQLGPVIGKVGGVEVQKTAVSATVTEQRAYDLHTVEIPAGQTWLVVVSGHMTNGNLTQTGSAPYFQIGSHEGARFREAVGEVGMAAEVSGNTTVSLVSQRSHAGFDFSGHVWAVPLTT